MDATTEPDLGRSITTTTTNLAIACVIEIQQNCGIPTTTRMRAGRDDWTDFTTIKKTENTKNITRAQQSPLRGARDQYLSFGRIRYHIGLHRYIVPPSGKRRSATTGAVRFYMTSIWGTRRTGRFSRTTHINGMRWPEGTTSGIYTYAPDLEALAMHEFRYTHLARCIHLVA